MHPPFFLYSSRAHRDLHSFPTRRSSDLDLLRRRVAVQQVAPLIDRHDARRDAAQHVRRFQSGLAQLSRQGLPLRRSEEHTSELQSRFDLVCRLLLEKKKSKIQTVSVLNT